MDRATLGQKISINLAIQGQIEDAKAKLSKFSNDKADADAIVEKGVEAKVLSDSLASKIVDVKANLSALEDELAKSDGELEAANAKVPRLINEAKAPPVHIRF